MIEVFMNADYGVLWSAIGAIASGLATVLGGAALLYSMIAYKESLQVSHYSELDSIYSNLLQLALDKTHLCNPHAQRDEEQKAEYDIYAFMVWNFLETISDRCSGNAPLEETWNPILVTESKRHMKWFKDSANQGKFKKSFHNHIDQLVAATVAPVQSIQNKAS